MITILMDFDSPKCQESYDFEIEQISLFALSCPSCQAVGLFSRHAFYGRSFKYETEAGFEKVRLSVLRVICDGCRSTHALLPSWIVPYSQHLLENQIEIIEAFESGAKAGTIESLNPNITPSNIAYILNAYLANWQQRLLTIKRSISDEAGLLIESCFSEYRRQFMQLKRTANRLFFPTT